MSLINARIVLASRPTGPVSPHNFRLESVELSPLAEGQVRVRNDYLSLDPTCAAAWNESKSYAASQPLDEVMIGGTVGEVDRVAQRALPVGCQRWWAWAAGSSTSRSMRASAACSRRWTRPMCRSVPILGPWACRRHGLVWPQPHHQNKAGRPSSSARPAAVGGSGGASSPKAGRLLPRRGRGWLRQVPLRHGRLGFDACIDYREHPDARSGTQTLGGLSAGHRRHFENVGGLILDAVLMLRQCLQPRGPVRHDRWLRWPAHPDGRAAAHPREPHAHQGFIVSEHMEVGPCRP